MGGTFEVHRIYTLPGNLFAVGGQIIDGDVNTGMFAELEIDGEIVFSEPVHSVTFSGPEGEPALDEPALAFSYSSELKLERWQAHDWKGRNIQLVWRSSLG